MTEEEAKNYRWNHLIYQDWSHKDFPLIEVGVMELNENPKKLICILSSNLHLHLHM
jgi:catalase